MDKETYKQYSQDVERYTRQIDVKESTETSGIVKKLVFSKMAWQESLTWFAIVQTMFIFLGLMDDVVNNVNSGIVSFMGLFGVTNPFQFPVDMVAFAAIGFVLFLFIFGLIGYKYLRTPQTTQMISVKNNGAFLMLWDILQQTRKENETIKTEISEIKENLKQGK